MESLTQGDEECAIALLLLLLPNIKVIEMDYPVVFCMLMKRAIDVSGNFDALRKLEKLTANGKYTY